MKSQDQASFFYNEVNKLIEINDHLGAIKSIKKNIDTLQNLDDIALAYLNCGFLNDKFGDNISAIKDFTKSISIESELEILNQRSKDISLSGRSNSRFKNADYKGSIEDKRKAIKVRSLEIDKFTKLNNIKIDYKNILLGTFLKTDLSLKYNVLIKVSKIETRRYDLISDYKKVISNERKEEVIKKLESLSESKYKLGDFKGSIKAIRRAEKYY